MKNKKILLIILMAVMTNLFLVASALADTDMSSQVEQDIQAGRLELNFIPSSSNLVFADVSAADLLDADYTNTISNPGGLGWAIIWSDTRNSLVPLSLNMGLDANFVGENTSTVVGGSYFSGRDNGTIQTVFGRTSCTGYSLQSTWRDTASGAFSLYSDTSSIRYERCRAFPDFQFIIPQNTPIDNYTATITFSLS